LPRAAGAAARGEPALQAGELAQAGQPALLVAHPRPRLGHRGRLRAVVQRVAEARVVVDGRTVARVGAGLCVLLGIADGDEGAAAERLAGRVARLRVFANDRGNFDRSLLDIGGAALVVSQFTLLADTSRGRGTRPDFSKAAPKAQAEPLYETFCQALRDLGIPVETGVFGARMRLELVNDGPVTIVLDM
jgi:D-tyrosyl-tRNA(Tyr) deacylase